jgi:hypothetical protein
VLLESALSVAFLFLACGSAGGVAGAGATDIFNICDEVF